jgi:integrase
LGWLENSAQIIACHFAGGQAIASILLPQRCPKGWGPAMTAKRRLTYRTLEAMKPAAKGKRYDVSDAEVPGLLVRVTESGVRTFVLSARFPGSKWSTRRALGIYPDLTLEKAREKAREWRQMIRTGIDPAVAEEEARQTVLRRQANTFAIVAEEFIAHCHRAGQRQAAKVERAFRKVFIPAWSMRPLTAITPLDVRSVIDPYVKAGKQARAHNLLELVTRFFNWAMEGDAYGLDRSPCDRMRPKKIIGKRRKRKRVLTEEELRAFWVATGRMEYPNKQYLRLLLLTIQREMEVAKATRPEIDLDRPPRPTREGPVWIVPPERMKMDDPHIVPLSPIAVELFREVPIFTKGDHLFTTTFGKKAINGFSKLKLDLDALMLEALKEAATARGEDPSKVELRHWVFHDLRRTGRTHLSALPIPDVVRERVIAHKPSTLHQHYDLWDYIDEKRHALELWAARLLSIVEPKGSNVIDLAAARG